MKSLDNASTSTAAVQRKASATSFFGHTSEQETPFFAAKGEGRSDSFFNAAQLSKGFKPLESSRPTIQAKLTVGAPNDKYEQEADSMADKVVQRMGQSEMLQRQTPPSVSAVGNEHLQKMDEEKQPEAMPELQRSPVSKVGEAKELQRKKEGGAIQRKGNGESVASPDIELRLSASKGGGSPLPNETRGQMESTMGADFSGVRVHTGSEAVGMSQDLNAHAFTHGSDVYFNSGKYNPSNTEGARLLAHELTHTVQQTSKTQTIQPKNDLKSARFTQQKGLDDAYNNIKLIKKGDKGLQVTVLQQALIDAGQKLPKFGVDGVFEDETEAAVKAFQAAQGVTVDGIVGEKTVGKLETYFLDRTHMADFAKSRNPKQLPTKGVATDVNNTPPELLEGTRSLGAEEKKEIERLRTTEVKAGVGGVLPTFDEKNPAPGYEQSVKTAALATVDAQYNNSGKGKEALHKDPANLHSWAFIEGIASSAQKETDKVLGQYALGHAFKSGVNLLDAWDQKEAEFAAGGAVYEQAKVEWRVNKIFGGSLTAIDAAHGAVQSRAAEKAILTKVRNEIIALRRKELIDTHKGWGGFADPNTRSVFIQRFKSKDALGNRQYAWKNFNTLVHEYIHTLEHPEFIKYRKTLDELKGGKTYREGLTEYFTKTVLESINYDAALRQAVEGNYYDAANPFAIPPYGGYKEAANAEAVVGVAGISNVMAAFFLGKTKLIGE